jgi:HSP20 family molecular chaperone IbpA
LTTSIEQTVQAVMADVLGVDASGIDARLDNGVLTVRIPKTPAAQPRRIEVKAA